MRHLISSGEEYNGYCTIIEFVLPVPKSDFSENTLGSQYSPKQFILHVPIDLKNIKMKPMSQELCNFDFGANTSFQHWILSGDFEGIIKDTSYEYLKRIFDSSAPISTISH